MSTTLDRIHTAAETAPETMSPDTFARAIWTMIAEPGDSSTGQLVATFGAAEALRYVVNEDTPTYENINVQSIRERTLPRTSPDYLRHALLRSTTRRINR